MPGFFEQLAVAAAKRLEQSSQPQVMRWIDQAVQFADTTLVNDVPERLQPLIIAGSGVLSKHRDLIAKTTVQGFTEIVQSVALGKDDYARQVFLRERASVQAIFDILDADAAATQDSIRKEAEEWAAIMEVVQEYLQVAGQLAIPLLVSFI